MTIGWTAQPCLLKMMLNKSHNLSELAKYVCWRQRFFYQHNDKAFLFNVAAKCSLPMYCVAINKDILKKHFGIYAYLLGKCEIRREIPLSCMRAKYETRLA